jgi:putative ABC transport system permease protein
MMEWFNILMARLRALFRRESVLRDIEEELRVHVEMETETNIERGMPPDEARAAALKSFGALVRNTERGYDIRGGGWLETLWQDLRYGLRMMLKNPGFTTIALLTLALGIGANTAIFSVVNVLLFKPLPYPGSERLMQLYKFNNASRRESPMWEYPKFEMLRDQNRSFDLVAAFQNNSATITSDGEPERVNFEFVSANYFPLLGLSPVIGRTFGAEEDRTPGAHPVAMIGSGLWRRRFGADPQVIGKTLSISGKPYTIIGVLPAEFRGQWGDAEMWLPIMMWPGFRFPSNAKNSWAFILARLKPDVTVRAAQAEMDGLTRKMIEAFPPMDIRLPGFGKESVRLEALKDARTNPELKNAFVILLAAAGFVLLIACANTANLLLARADSRRKEMAVRIALGAGRLRLVRQMLTESALLSVAGGAAGLLVAKWGVDLLTSFKSGSMGGFWKDYILTLRLYSIGLDWQALLFNLLISLGAGLLFGLAPAFGALRADVNATLKTGGSGARGNSPSRRLSLRGVLVVAEVALAVVLLAGAGLMIRSLARLQSVNRGFDPAGVTTFRVAAGGARPDFFDQLRERVAALPGVEMASLSMTAPLSGGYGSNTMNIQGRPKPEDATGSIVNQYPVSPEYFPTYRIQIKRGRGLTDDDRAGSKPVAVISETAASKFWPDEDPVGKLINFEHHKEWLEIVGVVADVKNNRLEDPASADVYIPLTQYDDRPSMLSVRGTIDKAALTAVVKREISALDRNIPLTAIKTMDEKFSEAMAQARYNALLLGLFAALALVMSQMGIYGVMSYAVSARTHEIGIRMALGAGQRAVLRLIIGQGMKLAAAGLAIGLIAAVAVTRVIKTLLFDVGPNDPTTLCAVALLLAIIALLACWIPARRATRVDPLVMLRHE